eukprot:TRINITY_DN13379_c0_g2_i1.p1 TRINITY_DN13379_c0_g2~~TRINITY_DN13379_c0_g2_i1.p1  ORF type:complete len:291 (+),score=99.79 TRINITY_DN13379_c0_g2_i1:122-874(+)
MQSALQGYTQQIQQLQQLQQVLQLQQMQQQSPGVPADLQALMANPQMQQLLMGNTLQQMQQMQMQQQTAALQPQAQPASVPASSRTSQCSEETREVGDDTRTPSDTAAVPTAQPDEVQTRPAGERPPCTHNKWTRREEERARRVKKKRPLVLCCLVCQQTWKTKLRLHKKCPEFFNGECKKGDACPFPHIYSRKVAAAAGILVPPSCRQDECASSHTDSEGESEGELPPLGTDILATPVDCLLHPTAPAH